MNSALIETRIRPGRGLAIVDFAELRRYRDLLGMFVWRDFATKYKQTILGPIWFLVQPLLPTIVFTIVFGQVAGMSTEGVPGFLFFLCNQVAWNYLAASYTSISNSLLSNLPLFSKVYFPRVVVPLSALLSNLITLAIQLALFAACSLYVHYTRGGTHGLTLRVLLLPLVVVHLAATALGFGLWMAAMTGKYRDLQQVAPVLLQVWMYGSAVMYPLSQMPHKYQFLLSVNPATFAIEASRICLLGVGTVSVATGTWSVGLTLVVLLTGLRVFNRAAQTFVDVA